jgi:hypothetical protein
MLHLKNKNKKPVALLKIFNKGMLLFADFEIGGQQSNRPLYFIAFAMIFKYTFFLITN